jgi:hypothetical protein
MSNKLFPFLAICTIGVAFATSSMPAMAQSIITFDPAGSVNTFPEQNVQEGTITGSYVDANNVNHGFLRAPSGTITSFDAPGAGTSPGQGTFPVSITPAGAITGNYVDASNVTHGFVRSADNER